MHLELMWTAAISSLLLIHHIPLVQTHYKLEGNLKYQYDYIQTDNELAQATSNFGKWMEDVINPTENVNIIYIPNPSYSLLPQDGQDVKLEDAHPI